MGVVDLEGEFVEDVLVAEGGFLEAVQCVSVIRKLDVEFFEGEKLERTFLW